MSNQVEQIRAEVERRIKSWQAGIKYEGDAGDGQSRVTELTDLKKFIDSLPAKENPVLVPESKETPIEVCGKKVVVRYTKDGHPCEKCVLDGTKGCNSIKCSLLDRMGMEIDERAYFVEAEQPEETHYLREWAQILATNSELRAKFDKLCPPQPIQGSVEPFGKYKESLHIPESCKENGDSFTGAELEAEVRAYCNEKLRYEHEEDGYFTDGFGSVIREDMIDLARHFAEWGAEHLKK